MKCIILAISLLLTSILMADGDWTLTTSDFRQQPVALDGMDSAGVRVTPAGSQQTVTVPFDAFLQLDRATAERLPPGKFTLFLAGGDCVEGEPAGCKDEQVLWRSEALGDMAIPLKSARALVRSPNTLDGQDSARTDDKVIMNNGDSVKGIVTNLGQTTLTIQADSALDIPLDSVKCVYFAAAGAPTALTQRAFRVRLGDGSIITAAAVRVDGQNLLLSLRDGRGGVSPPGEAGRAIPAPALRTVPLASVWGIEQLNGPVSWLSSRQAERVVQVPFLGSNPWPTRMDATVGGRPIAFAGRIYARGIGVHAYSRIDYALDGGYEAFRTQYAISQEEKRQYADVTVRIKVDGKVVHEQRDLRADVLSPVVMIDLPRTARMLTLEVDYGAANDTQDRFNWIEPALLRHKPVAAPATQP